jgi:peptide methionine sulfoxide reductase MsrA
MLSYPELLEIFWASHNPRARRWSTQYQAAIFVHNEPQEEQARKSLAAISARRRGKIRTPILQAQTFYPAEDYHQKYYLQHQRDLWAYFTDVYPVHSDIVESTAAARINGLLGGHGRVTEEDLQALLPKELQSILAPE